MLRPLGLVYTFVILCLLLVHANFENARGQTLFTSLLPTGLLLSVQFYIAYHYLEVNDTQLTL
jgi:hypothetical protein